MTLENPMSLDGQNIIVTGASSGIGRTTCQVLASLGARTIGIGRNNKRLTETWDSLSGDGHLTRSVDLSDTDSIPEMVSEIASEVGPISGIVHSAGVQQAKPLRVVGTADFESIYRINVVAAAMLIKGVSRRKVAHERGCSCVLIGSTMGVVGAPGLTAYCTSKSALTGLVRASALELAPRKIRVNAILAGLVNTEMAERHRTLLGPEHVEEMRRQHPLDFGEPQDVAYAAAFLLADTGRWITGTCLHVDGGYCAH